MNLDRLCDNASTAIARCEAVTDRHGREAVLVVVKATFAVSAAGEVRLAVPPSPVRWADQPYAGVQAVRFPHDLAPEKPGTDALLVGMAHPPPGSPVASVDVTFRVGPLSRAIRVHGRRVWFRGVMGLKPGPAGPLAPTPLVEDAPFGRDEPVEGAPAPRIEDPARPGIAATLSPLSSRHPLRMALRGTHDERWRRERAPVLPEDFDPMYESVAPPGLHTRVPLESDAPVEIVGATPEGRWSFRLPRFAPRFFSRVLGEEREHPTHLDTFLVDAERRRVELVWRAKIELPRRRAHLERISVVEAESLPVEICRAAREELERAAAGERVWP